MLGEFDEPCDGYIVNSCTVTAVSDKKTRNAIRRAQKLNPNAAVGVCGCYAQSAPEEVRALGVDVMVGTADREAFVLQMEQAAQDKSRHVHWEKVEPSGLPRAFEQLPAGGLAARTRALLKIEDGCNSFCTYCIIPYARGRVRSMPLEAAVEETKRLAREGYREIVINGIEISSWGWEWKDGSRLPQLLLSVCEAARQMRSTRSSSSFASRRRAAHSSRARTKSRQTSATRSMRRKASSKAQSRSRHKAVPRRRVPFALEIRWSF